MRGVYPTGGRETYQDNPPLVRMGAATRSVIHVDTKRPCGACGEPTDNRPSMAKDGLPARLCGKCTRMYLIDGKPWRAKR